MIRKVIIFTIVIFTSSQSFASILKEFEHEQPVELNNIQFTDSSRAINSLDDYKGKVVLLNFWATWCKPCVKEMPSLSALQENIKGRSIKIIPLSVDFKGMEAIKEFYEKMQIDNLPIFLDRNGMGFKSFELKALPTTIIINKEGKETARVLGELDWSSKEIRDYLIRMTRE